MALSHLLQPKSSFQVCRFTFATATARFCSSRCSNGEGCNPPELKKEAAAEDTTVEQFVKESLGEKSGLFSEATFFGNVMVGYVNKAKRLAEIFREHNDDQTETMAQNEGRAREEALSDYQHLRYEGDERSSQSSSCQKVLDLIDSSMKSAYDQPAPEIDNPMSLAFTYQHSEHSNEPHGQEADEISSKGLINFVRLQEDVPSNSTNCCSAADHMKDNTSNTDLQESDKIDGLNLLDFSAGTSSIKDMETNNLDSESIDFKELKDCLNVSGPTSNKDQRQRKKTCFARTESEDNRVLVRFLRSHVTKSQIFECFNSCGEILKVECPYAQGPLLKTAYIDFKTRKGSEKALKKSGSFIQNGAIIVESATLMEKKTLKIPIPSLLGDPDVPAALVKNPTRTIKIEQLTHEISSHHIEEALAFCKSNVSCYSLRSSNSVAYVEFETEIGKQRALAKQSINVLGRHLVMLRIDCPRTTAVRISNVDYLKLENILSLCKSLGDISISLRRGPDILDVHFKLAEWPNMVKILNRLNGCVVEGRQLQAEPAPVFPPDVLRALWHHPEERKHLKATMQLLLHKLVENTLDASELAFLDNDFFGKKKDVIA